MHKNNSSLSPAKCIMATGILGIDKTWRNIKNGVLSVQEYELKLRRNIESHLKPEYEDKAMYQQIFDAHLAVSNQEIMKILPKLKRSFMRKKTDFFPKSSWIPGESLETDLSKLKLKKRSPKDKWKDGARIQWEQFINPLEAMMSESNISEVETRAFIRSRRDVLTDLKSTRSNDINRRSKGSPGYQKKRVPFDSMHALKDSGVKIKSLFQPEHGSHEVRHRREIFLASNAILQAINLSYSPNIKPSDFHLNLSSSDKKGRFRNYKKKLAEIAKLSRARTIEDFRRIYYIKTFDCARAIAEKRPESECEAHILSTALLVWHVNSKYKERLRLPDDLTGLPNSPQSGFV